ncbi:synaptosomal-associated protein 25-B-like [Bolinopsis microptera]|uniref:synaptosomal-associated protein 25-B-like n=1 Tax=Bolinopsis microptera TaxID=2820187 RepID=UPI00307A4F01
MSNPFDEPSSSSRNYSRPRTSYNYRDHQAVQEQCQEKQKNIEDSTTESLRLVQETLNMGAATAAELEGQGKQIDKIHDNLVDINQSVKKSEHHVRGIKSIFGALWNRATGPPKEQVNIPKVEPVAAPPRPAAGPGRDVRSGPVFTQEKHRLDTDRTHDNLQQIGVGVQSMREMALAMGGELDRQNKKLVDVNQEADKANLGVNKLTKDMNKIIAKS